MILSQTLHEFNLNRLSHNNSYHHYNYNPEIEYQIEGVTQIQVNTAHPQQ